MQRDAEEGAGEEEGVGQGGGEGRSAPCAQRDTPPPLPPSLHPGLSLGRSPIGMYHVHLPCIYHERAMHVLCMLHVPCMCHACACMCYACAGGAQEGEEAEDGHRCREVARPAEQGGIGRHGGAGEPACPRGGGKRARAGVWGEAEGSGGAGQRRAVAQPEEVGQVRAAKRQPREGGRHRHRGGLVSAVPRAPCGPGAQPVAACGRPLARRACEGRPGPTARPASACGRPRSASPSCWARAISSSTLASKT